MNAHKKKSFPVSKIRRYLEPGPIVLVSSAWRGETNIMTMGWYTVMEFAPALIGCMITAANHSYEMIRRSKECVLNIPTVDLIDTAVGIGNCTGAKIDKFEKFGLTRVSGKEVATPMIGECYANIECRLADSKMLSKYNFFIFEAVRAHVASTTKISSNIPLHRRRYFHDFRGHLNKARKFSRQNL